MQKFTKNLFNVKKYKIDWNLIYKVSQNEVIVYQQNFYKQK